MPLFLRVLLAVNAAIALANAMVALAAPGASMSLYGVGGRIEPGLALRRVILALFASDLVGFTVSVHGELSGAMNVAGWGLALVYAIFATGYAMVLMRSPAASPKPATGQGGAGGRSAGRDG